MNLDLIKIVLVQTSHPGNIGATARAMKNMGLSKLALVTPLVFPDQAAIARAAGADEILQNAEMFADLPAAIADCHIVYGTSARSRTLPWPVCTPKVCAEQILQKPSQKIAIVFGRENSGLTNEELAHCHQHINIPTVDEFSSLNLAQAVQVIAYELYEASLKNPLIQEENLPLATSAEVEGFIQHLFKTMERVEFMHPKRSKLLKRRLHRLFNRHYLEVEEVNILRGFLTAIDKCID